MNRCGSLLVVLALLNHASATEPFSIGYADKWSHRPGEVANFYFSGPENPAAELSILDVYWNEVTTVTASISPQQRAEDNIAPWETGYGFEPTSLQIPDLPGGLYFVSGPEHSDRSIPFIVNEPDKQADVVVVYPTNTVNAYARTPAFGHPNFDRASFGVNLYTTGNDGRNPPAVSFHRPQNNFKVRSTRIFDRWMIEEGFDFKYISDAELEDFDSIAGAKVVLLPGHSEYWTETARRNFDRFVDLGGSGLVLSGNVMYRSVGYDAPDAPTQMTFWPRLQFTDPGPDYPTWESIGADYRHGGIGSTTNNPKPSIEVPYFGFKMLDVSPSYFEGAGLEVGDVLHNPSAEYDGVPHLSVDPETGPVVDYDRLGFHRLDLIAFENTSNGRERDTAGTWIDFHKTEDSGRIINVGSSHWTPFNGPTENRAVKREITRKMVELMLIVQADFDDDELLTASDVQILIEQINSDDARMRYDITGDEIVDNKDLDRWLHGFANTTHGDSNLDGKVDFTDFLTVSGHFTSNTDAVWASGDFTGDKAVDFADFLIVSKNYGDSNIDLIDLVDQMCADTGEMSGTTLDDVLSTLADAGHLIGDLDGDGRVAFGDFLQLSKNFAKSEQTWSDGDLNCSGTITFSDVLMLSANFGAQTAVAVPEPKATPLLIFVAMTLFARRSRMQTR